MVGRTFAWLGRNRRLSKDYEANPRVSEAWVYLGMLRLLVKWLARAALLLAGDFYDSFSVVCLSSLTATDAALPIAAAKTEHALPKAQGSVLAVQKPLF